ncbi:hypothetical protein PG989_015731 [Apiospora arundinis]
MLRQDVAKDAGPPLGPVAGPEARLGLQLEAKGDETGDDGRGAAEAPVVGRLVVFEPHISMHTQQDPRAACAEKLGEEEDSLRVARVR